MGKLNDTVNSLPGDGGERDYAKEVKITSGTSNVLRFLDGQDSFMWYYISWIPSDDDEVIRPYIIENEFEGLSILGRLLGDRNNYFRGGYLESKKGQFGKVNTYQTKDPELYKVMTEYWNPAYSGTGSCRPKLEFIFNVLHRNPEVVNNATVQWCSVEKHTKIIRMGQRALKVLKSVVDNDGDTSEYDINYTKQGTGTDTMPTMQKAGVNVTNAVPGPLSEIERSFERYDLKDIIKLTSAYYCLKHIPNKIKRIDHVMGTNFFAEFEKQAKVEQELWERNKNASQTQYASQAVAAAAIAATNAEAPAAPAASADSPFNDDKIPFDKGSVDSRVPLATNMISCPKCGEQVPEGTVKCPKCQEQLMMQCDVCKNMIPVNASTCTICGAQYK
ncbi:MAG TPA: zinc ribbon domain-containing protein [Methanofastidiosum sp.]|nr:zinc ribbon domain-containing protein [Methanofastidiosum sp.]